MKRELRDYVTGRRVADKIRQLRESCAHAGSFLLVEGNKDRRAFMPFVDRTCSVQIGEGWHNVVEAMRLLSSESMPGLLAIIDADCRRLEGAPAQPNVLWTDHRDLEVMLVASGAFERVLIEHADPAKVAEFEKARRGDLRTMLLVAGRPLGLLRWLSERAGLALDFKALVFSRFVDGKTLSVDQAAMIQHVCNKSGRHDLLAADLRGQMARLPTTNLDDRDLCCGHDLVEILALALRGTLGPGSNAANAETLESTLRAGWQWHQLGATSLYREVRAWEAGHRPFAIFGALPALQEPPGATGAAS